MLDKLELSEHTVEANWFRVRLVLNQVTAIKGGKRWPVVAVDDDDDRWIVVRKDEGDNWADSRLGPYRYFFIQAKHVRLEVEPGCLTE